MVVQIKITESGHREIMKIDCRIWSNYFAYYLVIIRVIISMRTLIVIGYI